MNGANVRAKELKPEAIEQTARIVTGHMGWLEANAGQIANRGNSDCDEGLSGRSYEGDGRGGSDSTSTEKHALATSRDSVTPHVVLFNQLLKELARTASDLRQVGAKIMPAWDDETKPLTDRRSLRDAMTTAARSERLMGADYCKVCNTYCTGGGADRIVAGRCPTCLKYWDRHHREADRPKDLWDVSALADRETA